MKKTFLCMLVFSLGRLFVVEMKLETGRALLEGRLLSITVQSRLVISWKSIQAHWNKIARLIR